MRRSAQIMVTGPAERKLIQPLGNVVSWLLLFTVALYALFLVMVPLDTQASLYGFGSGPVCTDVPLNGITVSGNGPIVAHLRPGASSYSGQLGVCLDHPSLGQRVLVTLTQAPAAALYVTVLVLLWRLLRTVRSAGPFDLLISRRLRFLGWVILAGSLAVEVGQAAAKSLFTATVVTDQVPIASNIINDLINGLLTPLLIASGLLTLARVMRVGAQMNEDLAGTV